MPWSVVVESSHLAGEIGFVGDIRGLRGGTCRNRFPRGRGSVMRSFGACFQETEAVESAVELVLEAGFGTIHQLDRTAGVAGAAVGESSAGRSGEIGGLGVQTIFVVDDGGFEIGHADETPAGSGHGIDQSGLGWRGGLYSA